MMLKVLWPGQVLMLLFEQRDRLKATNKFIYTGKYKKKRKGWLQAKSNK